MEHMYKALLSVGTEDFRTHYDSDSVRCTEDRGQQSRDPRRHRSDENSKENEKYSGNSDSSNSPLRASKGTEFLSLIVQSPAKLAMLVEIRVDCGHVIQC